MATIADEFIIRLGLDPTSFRKGREQAEQEFKKTQEAARRRQANGGEQQGRC